MTADEQNHIDEVRAIVRAYGPLCGCETRHHEQGCRWQLDADSLDLLHQQLLVDPFPAPRMDPDDQIDLLVRVHADPQYAAAVLARFDQLFGIST